MAKLILLRHGQSTWNKRNVFTGWVNIGLSEQGIEECRQAGKKIKECNIDVVYSSSLIRAQESALLALSEHTSNKTPYIVASDNDPKKSWYRNASDETDGVPVYTAWELNERMYGELQGKNKQETKDKYGPEQVQVWRRSFKGKPPGGESLEDTAARAIPFFNKQIVPHLKQNKDVLIVAHGNSLRAIVMYIENISEEKILNFEIATGEVLSYDYQNSTQGFRRL